MATDAELNQLEDLLRKGALGEVPGGPPAAWCQEQLDSMREWRGHYDVVAPSRNANFDQMFLLVRFAMPLKPTAP